MLAGEVKPWIGRRTADSTRSLSLDAAAMVDRRVAPWAHGLSWGRLEAVIEAACIEADPETAHAAAESAATAQGVLVGQSNDHGIKDIHIRTEAPNAIWFDASVDRIAGSLRLLGDESTKDIRRARAVGVIAQPQHALDLYARVATAAPRVADSGTSLGCSEPGEEGVITGAQAASETIQPTAVDGRPCRVDPRPPVTLYVHVAADAVSGHSVGTAGGVARVEGVGAVTAEQVKSWLGDCTVTVKPVIDLARSGTGRRLRSPTGSAKQSTCAIRSTSSLTPATPAVRETSTIPIPTSIRSTADRPARPDSTISGP